MKATIISLLLNFILVITGCSLNEGTEKLYTQQNVLQIELVLPEEIEVDNQYEIKAIFTDQTGTIPQIENITFTIWQNGMKDEEVIVPEYEGNGTYWIEKTFKDEGLYFVKVQANTKETMVMPTKQFSVGTLNEEDIETLPNQGNEQGHEGHH